MSDYVSVYLDDEVQSTVGRRVGTESQGSREGGKRGGEKMERMKG